MKSSLEEKNEIQSTTPTIRKISNLPAKENSYLFNHIDRLAAEHDVTVSNTMIKVTYKKPLKDHYASVCVNGIDSSINPVLIENNMNSSLKKQEVCNKKNKTKTGNIQTSSSNLKLVPAKESSVTPKINIKTELDSDGDQYDEFNENKKKELVNGLKIVNFNDVKVEDIESNDNTSKIGKNSQENSSLQKIKTEITQKDESSKRKFQSDEVMFLKEINLVKVKNSISKNSLLEKKPDIKKISQNLMKSSNKSDIIVKSDIESVTPVDVSVKKVKKADFSSKIVKKRLSDGKVDFRHKKMGGSEKNKNKMRVEESNNKKPLLVVDPDLPTGWKRYIRTRNKGLPDQKHIVYVVSPQGRKFRFKWKLRRYLETTKSKLDADQFFFGLYKRTKPSIVPVVGNGKEYKASTDVNALKIKRSNSTSEEASYNELDNAEKPSEVDGKELLHYDPDLPFGWKRVIKQNNSTGKLQVHIISPEGRIFQRRYRLNKYLEKHQYSHNVDRFYFGLYPKKDGVINISGSSVGSPKNSSDSQTDLEESVLDESYEDAKELADDAEGNSPMYDDPNLPEGWKRFIKVRGCGESAGRMEVVIVGPDGRRLRCRSQVEHYLQQNNLDYKAEDFDFSVYGKSKKRPTEPEVENFPPKKRFKSLINSKPVPDFDISTVKDIKLTPEGKMINEVNSLMINCELSTVRAQRRSRLSRNEHEKLIRSHIESEKDESTDGCAISTYWIQKLNKCRSDFRVLEPDAAVTIAERTKDFLIDLARRAFQCSQKPDEGLQYKDLADVIDESECLFPLRTIIPKKITYREFIKLNRPTQFLSFT